MLVLGVLEVLGVPCVLLVLPLLSVDESVSSPEDDEDSLLSLLDDTGADGGESCPTGLLVLELGGPLSGLSPSAASLTGV